MTNEIPAIIYLFKVSSDSIVIKEIFACATITHANP